MSSSVGKTASITVGIPIHNGVNPEHFQQAVESILHQSLSAECIHIIQDGEVNEELNSVIQDCAKHQNVQLIQLPKSGLPKALNVSIQQSTTEFYARMDSDDVAMSNRFEKQIHFMRKHPEIEIVGSSVLEFQDSGVEKILIMPNNYNILKRIYHYRTPLIHPSVMFRMSVFGKLGLYNEEFLTSQDIELWGRALKMGIQISNLPEILLRFRANNNLARRTNLGHIIRQFKARKTFSTKSPYLNFLKLSSTLFRFLPIPIQKWAYNNLRN